MGIEQFKIENLTAVLEDVLKFLKQQSELKNNSITFQEFVSYWFEAYAKIAVKQSTQKRYKELLKPAIQAIGSKPLSDVKPLDIQKIYISLTGKISDCTILKLHRLLHEIFKHAVMWEYISNNPVKKVLPPSPEKKVFDVWDAETAKRFLEVIRNETIYYPVLIALHTGMRAGEIVSLKWCDVNFEARIISVVKSVRNNRGLKTSDVKTKTSKRSVYINDVLYSELKNLYEITKPKPDDFVCPRLPTGNLTVEYLSKRFKKLVKRYNFPVIRFHDLRHTFATLMLSLGVNTKIVAEILGHSDIKLTADTYSHVLPTMQESAMKEFIKLWK
ncbi:integrase family protein [Caldicellulosiruptor kronotskyensis 2002]|uniref:Integrase family protein n=1 Tax=Caldicellulosiruptor kronotskyensis (strain DSM 18902 / VKM B-2412 / 2002) TaxID=632348 RepID=E4SEN7_CALK2|nr:site-specific integrase [Caldicellulosiruptor kronotskyensis]ADQ45524.1 integrase family protein [Caldicellulosiruptor kronotskyensis 2002]